MASRMPESESTRKILGWILVYSRKMYGWFKENSWGTEKREKKPDKPRWSNLLESVGLRYFDDQKSEKPTQQTTHRLCRITKFLQLPKSFYKLYQHDKFTASSQSWSCLILQPRAKCRKRKEKMAGKSRKSRQTLRLWLINSSSSSDEGMRFRSF